MSDLSDTSAYYSARPRIIIDGAEELGLAEGVVNLFVEETVEGLYRCEVTIGNWGDTGNGMGFLYFDEKLIEFGKRIEVRVGDGDADATIFTGHITGIEGRFPQERPPEMVLLAEDRFQDLRMTRRTRSFEDSTDEDIMRTLASDHGLQAKIDVTGPTWKVLTQVNQSDLAFLRERARAVDAELWIEGGTLFVQARAQRDLGEVKLTFGQRLREFSVLADLAGQCTSMKVTGWDVSAKETIEQKADKALLGSELASGDRSGSELLDKAFGGRVQQIVHQAPATDEQAKALAEGHFLRGARQFLRGSGVSEGDGRIRVGAKVELNGIGPFFKGAYQVVETRHTFEAESGYRTIFRVERPGLGAAQ